MRAYRSNRSIVSNETGGFEVSKSLSRPDQIDSDYPSKLKETSKQKETTQRSTRNYQYSKPKSHAKLMLTSMKTFMTEVNTRGPTDEYQSSETTEEKPKSQTDRAKLKNMYKTTSTFPKFLERLDKTVDKLKRINDRVQQTATSTQLPSADMTRSASKVHHNLITSSLDHELTTGSLGKISRMQFKDADFENPNMNDTLADIIQTIDKNKKAGTVVDAMWNDLGEGYKMYNELSYQRKQREKDLKALQQKYKALNASVSNKQLTDKISMIEDLILQTKEGLKEDQMRHESLEQMQHARKQDLDIIRQRFSKKHGPLPKILRGLEAEISSIQNDTVSIENTNNEIGKVYSHLKTIQQLRKSRDKDFVTEIKRNEKVEQNIEIEQDFKDQREKYFVKKHKNDERERRRQEIEKKEALNLEIRSCEQAIGKYKGDINTVMNNTKRFERNYGVIEYLNQLVATNTDLKEKKERIENSKTQREEERKKLINELDLLKTNNAEVMAINDTGEINRLMFQVERKRHSIDSSKKDAIESQKVIATYLTGITRIFDDVYKRKGELALPNLRPIACSEENMLEMLNNLTDIVEKLDKIEKDAELLEGAAHSQIIT